MKAKYIRDNKDNIIVFPETMNHSDFRRFNPVSAGFIHFTKLPYCEYQNSEDMVAVCYGESVSLNLQSNPIEDTILSTFRLFNNHIDNNDTVFVLCPHLRGLERA